MDEDEMTEPCGGPDGPAGRDRRRIAELEEALAALAAENLALVEGRLVDTALFHGLSVDPDGRAYLAIEPARELLTRMVGACRGLLGSAPNYCEMRVDWDSGKADPPGVELSLSRAGEGERFLVRIQRAGQLTPHEARVAAEARAEAAEAALADLRARLAPDAPPARGSTRP